MCSRKTSRRRAEMVGVRRELGDAVVGEDRAAPRGAAAVAGQSEPDLRRLRRRLHRANRNHERKVRIRCSRSAGAISSADMP